MGIRQIEDDIAALSTVLMAMLFTAGVSAAGAPPTRCKAITSCSKYCPRWASGCLSEQGQFVLAKARRPSWSGISGSVLNRHYPMGGTAAIAQYAQHRRPAGHR